MTLFGVFVAALIPVALLFTILSVANRLERARHEVRARQVAVTEAIHGELGAVVAPTVVKRPWGPWQVRIPVQFARPAMLERVLTIAHATLARLDGVASPRLEIVLVAREEVVHGRR